MKHGFGSQSPDFSPNPGFGIPNPGFGFPKPVFGLPNPDLEVKIRDLEVQIRDLASQIPDLDFQILDLDVQIQIWRAKSHRHKGLQSPQASHPVSKTNHQNKALLEIRIPKNAYVGVYNPWSYLFSEARMPDL